MTKRAVIYCRVSSPEQVKNNSLESQEKRCSEYCKREGYEIDKVFVEEGESAKTANRTELKNLLAYCSANRKKINVVVFDDVTRWSRKSFDYQFAKAQLKKLGIELKSPSVKIEDTPQSNMIENLLVAVGQFDNDTKAVQTVERMKLLSERGQKNHKAPLGYINCKDPLGKKIIKPDEKTAPFIQRAFESFSKGVQTKQAILDELTGRGFRNQRGKHVSPQTFYKLLRNETYAGWNVEKKWGGRYRGNWIPIITDETFQRVQALLDGKGFQASKKRDNPDFPFRGMVICGECKRPLTASFSTGKNKNKSYGYYFCQNKNCRKVKFRKEQIEENMLGFLRLIKFREEDVLEFGKKFVENLKIKRTQALGGYTDPKGQHRGPWKAKNRLFTSPFHREKVG